MTTNNIALNFLTNIPLTKENVSTGYKSEKIVNVSANATRLPSNEKEKLKKKLNDSTLNINLRESCNLGPVINENVNNSNSESGNNCDDSSTILKKYSQNQSNKKKLAFVTKYSRLTNKLWKMSPFYISSIVGNTKSKDETDAKKRSRSRSKTDITPLNSSSEKISPRFQLSPIDTEKYDPTFLDDPHLTTGKHRTDMHLDCGICSSIIPFVTKSKLNEELNQRFAEKHPDIPRSITLTNIRKIKKNLLRIGLSVGLDLTVIASSYIYFEKLILKKVVEKESMKLYAAICLVLSAKFYLDSISKEKLHSLTEALTEYVQQKIYPDEIKVYLLLNCSLMNNPLDIRTHYVQLQKNLLSTTDSVLLQYRSVLQTQSFDSDTFS